MLEIIRFQFTNAELVFSIETRFLESKVQEKRLLQINVDLVTVANYNPTVTRTTR